MIQDVEYITLHLFVQAIFIIHTLRFPSSALDMKFINIKIMRINE